MLLCAGHGTRLGPLGQQLPKPMLPVCDVAIVRYGIALLCGYGIRDIVINLHHKGEFIERELGDGSALGARIRYVHEDVIMGTGGGIKNALELLDPDRMDEPFVSLNGKLIFDIDLSSLLQAHRAAAGALGMMVVRQVPDALSWGAVDVALDGDVPRVRDILGRGEYMFCGVHVTRPSVVRQLPDGEACMIRQGYLPWLQSGHRVAAFVAKERAYFAEHSTPARYLQSNIDLLGGAGLSYPPGPLTGIHASADIHPSASIRPPVRIASRATVQRDAVVGPDAVVGRDAVIEANARVQGTVIWPGTRAHGELSQCIVTPHGAIEVDATGAGPALECRGQAGIL